MPNIRLFVGSGTATESYLRTLEMDGWATIVIGSRGLWAHIPAGRRMGQPPHLLQLPGQAVPPFQAPTGTTNPGLALFMAVQDYQAGLQTIAQPARHRINVPNATVTGISREGGRLKATVQGVGSMAHLMVDEVVIANGIGPQQTPEKARIAVTGTPDTTLGFVQIEEGTDYLQHPDRIGGDVAIYGGGPTGAWVASEVAARVPLWWWAARAEGAGFKTATLPGNRNAMILARAEHQVRMNILAARYVGVGQLSYPMAGPPRPATPKVELTVSPGAGQPSFKYYVDQLIYCIGGDPAAAGSVASILSPELAAELEPVRDINHMVSRDGNGVLAWRNPRRDALIIGASTYNFAIVGSKEKQGAPMTWLPPNAKVPDGIALAVSVIETLNQFMPVTPRPGSGPATFDWSINFNTANRTQIAVFLADKTDLDAFTANLTVALIIYFRSAKGHTFGITNLQVIYITRIAMQAVKAVRQANPGFELLRWFLERTQGVEHVLDNFILSMTAERLHPLWLAGGLRPVAEA